MHDHFILDYTHYHFQVDKNTLDKRLTALVNSGIVEIAPFFVKNSRRTKDFGRLQAAEKQIILFRLWQSRFNKAIYTVCFDG